MAKKIMKRSLALGALMAFVITGSAMAADPPTNFVGSGANITDGYLDTNFTVGANGSNTTIKSDSESEHAFVLGQKANQIANIIGDKINIQASLCGAKIGYSSDNYYPTLNLGNDKTQSITITSGDDSIRAIKGHVNITAKEINLTTTASGCGALWLQNSTDYSVIPDNATKVTIDADSINLNGVSGAIYAYSNSQLDIQGNLTAKAVNAIDVRGNSFVRINEDGTHKTVLNGDIVFETDHQKGGDPKGSGRLINSDTLVVFNGEGSAFNGRSYIMYPVKVGDHSYSNTVFVKNQGDDYEGYHGKVTDFVLKFSNGGTWNITGSSFVNAVDFGAGSVLNINDVTKYKTEYAINGNSDKIISIDGAAKLVVGGAAAGNYKIVDATDAVLNGAWVQENIVLDNALMTADWDVNAQAAKKLDLIISAKSADEIANSGITSESSSSAIAQIASQLGAAGGNVANMPIENQAAASFIKEVMSGAASGTKTAQNMKDAMDSALNIGENVGANANAAAVVNNVTGITTQRMSFTQMNTAPQGGHGKVERKYKTGEGVWAQYMHGKDKVEDMPMGDTTTSYDSQYNGIVFGYDFKEVGKTHTGIAFNYGSGDSSGSTSSTHSRSEFDFWGVGLYHSIMNDDTNLIFDINYNKSDTDVTQTGLGGTLTANPKTETMSFGVKAEKLIQNGPVQIVPYAGARFLTIDTDDYHVAGLNATYAPERQNVWLIPVGVSLRQENTYENGWKVTPKADLSYIWALGDTDSSMSVAVGNATPFTNKYTVMDNGSFLGTLGIEAAKGDWTYGLSYSYQKGEYQRSDKWFVDVRYSF